MSKIEKLESDVRELPVADFARFRDWFLQFDAEAWDQQIEADLKAGRSRAPISSSQAYRTTMVRPGQ